MLYLTILLGIAEHVANVTWAFIGVHVLYKIIKKKPIIEVHKKNEEE